jgi:hypothetical protein
MSALLIAEFVEARPLAEAAHAARGRKLRPVDAFTPYPVEDLIELIEPRPSRIRLVMLIAGLAVAALAYGTEYYSAVIDYPYNAGGRPLHSWPAFMLVPFATGILGASIAGLIAFLAETGLPRLHHPLFSVDGIERASQDRFLLALAKPQDDGEAREAVDWLRRAGARTVREVET